MSARTPEDVIADFMHPAWNMSREARAILTALRAAGYAVVPVGVVEALEKIASWCEAYPAQVFPKKSADHALDACKQAGIPVDAMHGTWARHLLSGIGRDARAALTAALALAEAEGAVLCVVPGEAHTVTTPDPPDWLAKTANNPHEAVVSWDLGHGAGHNDCRAATLAGRAWP